MIVSAFLKRIRMEPLDRKRHDRASFCCGEDRVDNFLQKSAGRQQRDDLTRVRVACLGATFDIAGFYALTSHSIDPSSLPDEQRKRLPPYPIGAVYLSVIGVHAAHQGKGLGTFLMADAFKRCLEIADLAGSHFVVLDALSENAARLYRRLGFVDLPSHPRRMLIKMDVIRKALASANAGAPKA